MARPKALLLGEIEHATESWNKISKLADIVTSKSKCRAEFVEECRSGRFDGVIVICDRAPLSINTTGKYDEALLRELPQSLKFICHNGAGYDNLDIAACTSRGILVSHTPKVVEDATADTAMFLILAAPRGFNNSILAIRNGTWKVHVPPGPLGHSPKGKTLGILGLVGIGRNLMKKAEAFGMKVIYHNRTPLSPELAGSAEYVDFGVSLAQSDALCLSVPLNMKTRNCISKTQFQQMKRGVVIVNTARGGVMDEDALVEAIESGIVWSVGLDVYQNEPNIHPGLLSNPHVCLLPHMGTSTVETKADMEELNIRNVRAALESGKQDNIVPEQYHLAGLSASVENTCKV